MYMYMHEEISVQDIIKKWHFLSFFFSLGFLHYLIFLTGEEGREGEKEGGKEGSYKEREEKIVHWTS